MLLKRNEINIRDPFVLVHEGKYYMYGTRCNPKYNEKTFRGFDVYVSDDLEHWTEPKSVFEAYDGFEGTKDFWAPEVHVYNGRFYMFASFKSDAIPRWCQILVSDTPDGFFEVHSEKITPSAWECLDGTLYVENNTPYMVFCHEWLQVINGEVCAVELEQDLTKAKGQPFVLWRAKDAAWVCPENAAKYFEDGHDFNGYVTDAPFFYKSGTGRLCSLWSSYSKEGYSLASAYSDSNSIKGKWHVDDELLFAKDGGHGMIFTDLDGQQKLAIHQPNTCGDERPVFLKVNL